MGHGDQGAAVVAPRSGRDQRGHFGLLDALRGLAALWVVLFHLTISSTLPPVEGGAAGFVWHTVFGRGALGVALFFVLSGFVIAYSLRRGLGSAEAVGSFLVRRVVRLTPPYWAAIAVAVVVHAMAAAVNNEPFAPGGAPLSPGRALSHLLYLEGLVGHTYINDVFWTLTVEMQFYLVLTLLLVVAAVVARYVGPSLQLLAPLVAVASVLAARSDANPQATFVPLFYSFFLGALLYWTWSRQVSLVTLGLYLAALGVVFVEDPDAFLAASILTGILILVASRVGDGLATWLAAPPFRFLGRISYSLYLVHVPVQGAVLLAVVRVLGTGPAAVVAASVASTVACVVASTVFWWAVERPAMAWASSLKRQPAVTGAGPAVPEPAGNPGAWPVR